MRFAQQTLEQFGNTFFEMTIPTNLSYKTPLVFRLVRELTERSYLPTEEDALAELAFDEALTNAMIHGNKMNQELKVRVALFADEQRWGALITDEGEGFSLSRLPRLDDPEAMFRETGRGILLMESYVDELVYNPRGNAVMLVRNYSKPKAAPPPATRMEPAPAPSSTAAATPLMGTVSISIDGDLALAAIHESRITSDNLAGVSAPLLEAAQIKAGLVLDLSAVDYISSAFIGFLMKLFRIMQGKHNPLALAALKTPVAEILKSVALDRIFNIYPTTTEAVAAVQKTLKETAR